MSKPIGPDLWELSRIPNIQSESGETGTTMLELKLGDVYLPYLGRKNARLLADLLRKAGKGESGGAITIDGETIRIEHADDGVRLTAAGEWHFTTEAANALADEIRKA